MIFGFGKVDKLVFRNSIGPFLATFFVVLFVLVMQFFYVYLDEFIGKGISWYILVKLVGYLSTNLVPLATPLAVLLTSIMTFGGLGERNELAAFKSGGLSLFRIMRGQVFFVIALVAFSILFSNFVVPKANLKFRVTLSDISRKKPSLNILPNTPYTDLSPYIIEIDSKSPNGKTIYGVSIIENDRTGKDYDQILAEKGELYVTNGGRYMVLKLYNGAKYQAMAKTSMAYKDNKHVRTYFDRLEKVIDLSALDLKSIDEGLYANSYFMMSAGQLISYVDSLKKTNRMIVKELPANMESFLYPFRDSMALKQSPDQMTVTDSIFLYDIRSFFEIANKKDGRLLATRALTHVKTMRSSVLHTRILPRLRSNQSYINRARAKFWEKFTLPVSCLLMFFIGAPLGAIIRKGGLGIPFLYSIVFYIIYVLLVKVGENMAKDESLDPFLAMWGPVLIYLPIGVYLTRQAMRDRRIHVFGFVLDLITFFKKKFSKE